MAELLTTLPSLSGAATICTSPATYTLSAGSASSWSVTPTSAFSLTSTYTASAMVKALAYNGQAGTLTALVNGVAITKTFTACSVTLSGPDTVCAANAVYSLPAGVAASSWTITPDSSFDITTTAGLDSAYVTPVGFSGQAGSLTAMVNGVPVTKIIIVCSITISGSDTVCAANAVYSLPNGFVADAPWTITPDSAFNITVTDGLDSAYVTPVGLSGQAGTLTAIVNGVEITKELVACNVTLSGSDTVCVANAVYSLPAGVAASSWTIAPDSTFEITVTAGLDSVYVTSISPEEQSGTLTAIVNGVPVTKIITACSATLSGPDTVCTANVVYSLPDGFVADAPWTIAPDSAFEVIAGDSVSATVRTLTLAGESGTLTATVNGVPVIKIITACSATLSGPDTICPAAVYTLSAGSATWSVTPSDTFQLFYDTGNSVMVSRTPNSWLSGQAGTLTATINGVVLTKAFQVCAPYIVGFDTIPVEVCAATYTLGGVPDNSPATGQWKIFDCGDDMSVLTDYGDYSVFDKTTVDEQPCTVAIIACALRMTLNGENYPFFAGEKKISIPAATPFTGGFLLIYPGTPSVITPSVSPVTSGTSGVYSLVVSTPVGAVDINPPVYQWTVIGPDGSIQTVYGSPASVTFSIVGTYTIYLGYVSCWPILSHSTIFTATPTYSLYPNPVTGSILNISSVSVSSVTCLSYTIRLVSTGAIVQQGQVSGTGQRVPFQINVSTLPAGMYLVQLSTCGTSRLPSTLIQTSVIVIP
ncbi:MAG: T9SS type A sorting domain-containing protein [Prevotellaceae bacterium]|nr:T9SS type A sorting domain-containing protein [Prevotellaceae bacterium]